LCGIAGIHVFNPDKSPDYTKMENAVDQLLAAIDYRGGDATGFVAIGDENVEWQKASCNAFEFYKERRNIPWRTRSILLHTRMATQGSAAFPENNHPVRRGSVYIVHNGHIWNDGEIFKTTKRQRYGQVDSEAIAAIVAKYGIMNTHKAMEEVSGAAAIGVVDDTRPGLMALARGSSSPLMFYHNEDVAIFASTKEAIKRAWKILYGTPPKDKNIEDVKEGVALYLDTTITREKFTPDDLFISSYSYGYSSKWEDKWDKKDFSSVAISRFNGEAKILCAHGYIKDNCETCNPDDEHGSYLPIKKDESDYNRRGWLDAKLCELCGKYFPEDEMTEVKDWEEDKWLFCDPCCDEMSEVIVDCDITRPTRIHESALDEKPNFTF